VLVRAALLFISSLSSLEADGCMRYFSLCDMIGSSNPSSLAKRSFDETADEDEGDGRGGVLEDVTQTPPAMKRQKVALKGVDEHEWEAPYAPNPKRREMSLDLD